MSNIWKVKRPWTVKGDYGPTGDRVYDQNLDKIRVIESNGPLSKFFVPWNRSGMTYYIRKHGGYIFFPRFDGRMPNYFNNDESWRLLAVPKNTLKKYSWHGWNVKFIMADDELTGVVYDTYFKAGYQPDKITDPQVSIPLVGQIWDGNSRSKRASYDDDKGGLRLDVGGSGGIEVGDELSFTWYDLKSNKGSIPANYSTGRWILKGSVAKMGDYLFQDA